MFIDTHCHINMAKIKNTEEIINNFKQNWWKYMICIWTDLKTSLECVNLAKKYDFIKATIWIHPSDIKKYFWKLDQTIEILEKMYLENSEFIVWIWECWFDYYWIDKDNLEQEKQQQKLFFEAQINLAKKYKLPIIIHNREAKEDTINLLKENKYTYFILHCFSENLVFANKCLDFAPNCKISFSWIVTFNSAKEIQETAKNIPLKNILIETDSPYLTPVPLRWKEENEPFFVKYVLDKIIELRNEDEKQIKSQIYKNSLEVFWIKE